MEIDYQFAQLQPGKKLYFASDFHLGAPNAKESANRERKIIEWFESIEDSAGGIFLVGDIFDFWFEYKQAIPRGFIRFQGKLAQLIDRGIPITFFSGNHDMWMFDYFKKELDINIHRDPKVYRVGEKKIYVGHGDGLGPGDSFYKFIKWFFQSKLCQWLFHRIHPNFGIGLAKSLSLRSRATNGHKDDKFLEENEWLLIYSREIEKKDHHDYYIFGHRHLPLKLEVADQSTYFNLGEWISQCNYLEFDGKEATLKNFNSECSNS